MSRLFLVFKSKGPPFKAHVEPWEVLAYDKATHRLSFRRPDGSTGVDPNFHIDIAKRCGYSLTAEPPEEFKHAKSHAKRHALQVAGAPNPSASS